MSMGSNTAFLLNEARGSKWHERMREMCQGSNGKKSLSGEKVLTGSQGQLNENII